MKSQQILESVGLYQAQVAKSAAKSTMPLEDQMLVGFLTRRYGALRYVKKGASRDVAVICDFRDFTGKPPWEWTENGFDSWCHQELFLNRGLKSSSQRTYQGVIRNYLEYLEKNVTFQETLWRQHRVKVRQICTSENCIPHVLEHEGDEGPAMTEEQVGLFFSTIDRMIIEASQFHSKDLLPLLRDKALFLTMYRFGLRCDETVSPNTGSFRSESNFPELKGYAVLGVWGKGSKGSGPKFRNVYLTFPEYVPVIDWYLTKIRPQFAKKAKDPNDDALFFSERGTRISDSSIRYRFGQILLSAGLTGQGFTPHSLRRSYVSHSGLALDTIKDQVGHVFPTTTLGYMRRPKELVLRDLRRAVSQQVKNATKQGVA
jgi:site-specific recombinase XerD